MTPPDRFGLQGAPEIQTAPRPQWGRTRTFFGLMLAARLFSALLFLADGPERRLPGVTPPELGWAAFGVFVLQFPVLLWGFWLLLTGRGQPKRRFLVTVSFVLAVFLDLASRPVSDLTQGRLLDPLHADMAALMLAMLVWMLMRGGSASPWTEF
ncbi:hypothetical protein ACINK0_06915 [Deinococcus sp. VB343]|uniref:hypothetical protein n=1 Tax=Deinococcus sp. VB343 TaxID=3385567 RepID=UPI0039C91678